MPKKRSKGKARALAVQPAEEPLGVLTPTDFITSQPLKVCRLCESKDGPFLNIFEADKVTAKKIEELMPFGVAENDELPHKICFRCSAKVEELYEFIQKCIKTQINLRTALGKKEPFTTKLKTHRSLWEEKLNKSNISNDDICDAVIKKAMEGIKDIPINPFPLENNKDTVESNPSASKDLSASKPVGKNNEVIKTKASQKSLAEHPKLIEISKEEIIDIDSDGNQGDEPQLSEKPVKGTGDKPKLRNVKSRLLRSNTEMANNEGQVSNKTKTAAKKTSTSDSSIATTDKKIIDLETDNNEANPNDTPKKESKKPRDQNSNQKEQMIEPQINTTQPDQKVCGQSTNTCAKQAKAEKPFDIMDHVSMIKVNGVGVLFQCKLCNRNFLKIDVVQSHSCAKNRCVPKEEIVRKLSPPEPPKPPTTVKYINTKLGGDVRKVTISDTTNSNDKTETDGDWRSVTEVDTTKPKPKIGPASKVKRDSEESVTSMVARKQSAADGPSGRKQIIPCGSVTLPPTPNLNCPYKLVRGPNNTFTLVEEPVNQEHDSKTHKLNKLSHEYQNSVEVKPKQRQSGNDSGYIGLRNSNSSMQESGKIEASKQVLHTQPYPVGLFQTLPKFSKPAPPPQTPNPLIFSATAAQKQSYSIVQTANPNKLLISSKPQVRAEEPVKKRKIKTVPTRAQMSESSTPFSVTLDDTSRPVDPDMFNFFNIDPLLTPSYVLPIPNESQSVATNNDRSDTAEHLAGGNGHYTCNMCNEVFTREQKLLAHIHSHYSKMDEEDNMRVSKTNRKRARKS